MGTKIEYSINLLATLVDSNNLAVGGVDVWEHFQNKHQRTGINKLQGPMDRMLDRNNVESIKKTMQMQEDIFKHQVRELHRVYTVQKMLMDDLKNEIRQQKIWNHTNDINVSHPHSIKQQHQTTQISHQPDFHVQNLRGGRGFDLERSAAEEDIFTQVRGFDEGEAGPSSHTALQSCKTSTSGYDEEMEVDLTLSIGVSQVKKNSHLPQLACSNSTNNGETRKLNSPASFKSDRTGECSDPTTPMSSSTVTFTQQRKGTHWLSQGLKLK
ncbi:hypothetical protein JHK82_046731 [Glycine max]|uniref:Uncharacterized protein n=1 Tax=Glycine max TaxID=3847 RepID=K7MK71_SOYBN|nr:uncharacterized protein LOC100500633 [Glycine max]KAG4929660.1 hypothetical protein JHK86_046621 [Glycine max]KAG5096877.1 hypothetical protein JHK82_046731 [Glycine max]KAH1117063.1 hypothetical protein GYH30_046420 [Glycine max]KAH1201273.1 hypothetical protein GmHk_17G048011 [Glycine max]KRH02842.1 hypothetical protein GLYMA_17G061500v4 [Glycine max]|eukprot:XP_003549348.1 uncharacterized protein LOC100500633 [Glycine max]